MSAQNKKKREQPPAFPSIVIYKIKYITVVGKVKEWLEQKLDFGHGKSETTEPT